MYCTACTDHGLCQQKELATRNQSHSNLIVEVIIIPIEDGSSNRGSEDSGGSDDDDDDDVGKSGRTVLSEAS